MANPPFSGKIQEESILADINLPTRDTELLFLKWFIDHLADGGRAGVIVPAGVMFGTNKAAKRVRDILLTDCDLQAVVELPDGVFQPYSTVTTACLIFQKGGPTKSVWFYELRNDGFTLSDTRTPIPLNDIPDVLAKWPTRAEGLQSRTVAVEKIIENEFRLMSAAYRPVALQTVEHREPKVLLDEIIGLERQIAERAATLRESISR